MCMAQKELGSVASSNARTPGIQTIAGGFDSHSLMDIGHKIMSTAILLSLPLIQVRQSVADKVLVILFLSLHRKSVVTLNDLLGMTIVVDWDVNPQNKQKQSHRI